MTASTTITGSAADVVSVINSAGITTDGDYLVTLAAGTAASADLNTISGDTSGAIDASLVTTITGTAANIVTGCSRCANYNGSQLRSDC